jgi:hypothetical protein
MTDSNVPDWIKNIKAEQDRKTNSEHTAALEAALTEKTIQADGPAYWKQFLSELQITVEGLKLIDVSALISAVPMPQEEGVQINVALPDRSRQEYVNLYYKNGGPGITRYPVATNTIGRMPFGVVRGNVVLFGRRDPLTAEEAARFFIEPMVEALKK